MPPREEFLTREERAALNARVKLRHENEVATSRLSLPLKYRLPLATAFSFLGGMMLGIPNGSQKAGLLFRAENAHRFPTTPTGWYLYHKSKNYQMALGGLKEGGKLGAKIGVWVAGYFGLENALDDYRGKKDFVSSVLASLVVAGAFSLRNGFDAITTARTAKKGLGFGLAFGLTQDALGYLRGRPLGYVDWIAGRRRDQEQHVDIT